MRRTWPSSASRSQRAPRDSRRRPAARGVVEPRRGLGAVPAPASRGAGRIGSAPVRHDMRRDRLDVLARDQERGPSSLEGTIGRASATLLANRPARAGSRLGSASETRARPAGRRYRTHRTYRSGPPSNPDACVLPCLGLRPPSPPEQAASRARRAGARRRAMTKRRAPRRDAMEARIEDARVRPQAPQEAPLLLARGVPGDTRAPPRGGVGSCSSPGATPTAVPPPPRGLRGRGERYANPTPRLFPVAVTLLVPQAR